MTKPAAIPTKGSTTAVTAIVTAAIIPAPGSEPAKAVWALPGIVIKAPSTKRKPEIDSDGINFANLGRRPKIRIKPMMTCIRTAARTGFGAEAVAEMIASKDIPPKRELAKSANPE